MIGVEPLLAPGRQSVVLELFKGDPVPLVNQAVDHDVGDVALPGQLLTIFEVVNQLQIGLENIGRCLRNIFICLTFFFFN